MENFNFIQWTDLKPTNRGGGNKLNDFEISCYRNLKPVKSGNCGNYVTFSDFLGEVYEKDTKVRVGHINSKVVFQFNNAEGISITKKETKNKTKSDTISTRCVSKEFVSIIYNSFDLNPTENSYRFKIIDLGNNTFMIDSIIKK